MRLPLVLHVKGENGGRVIDMVLDETDGREKRTIRRSTILASGILAFGGAYGATQGTESVLAALRADDAVTRAAAVGYGSVLGSAGLLGGWGAIEMGTVGLEVTRRLREEKT